MDTIIPLAHFPTPLRSCWEKKKSSTEAFFLFNLY